MKKFFALILAALLLPILSSADSFDESSWLGLWVQSSTTSMSSRKISTVSLEKYGQAYYSVDNYGTDGPASIERHVCSWSFSGNVLTLTENGETLRELYRINRHQLSADKDGLYWIFWDHVPTSEEEHSEAEAEAAAESARAAKAEISRDPVGRWTTFNMTPSGTVIVDHVYMFSDLVFLQNGAVYYVGADLAKDTGTPRYTTNEGIWIGDQNDLTLRVGAATLRGSVDENGVLSLSDGESVFNYYRVQTNFERGGTYD